MTAEIIGKKEILLQKEQVGVNVEKAKSHGSSVERFKSERHEKDLLKWAFDRPPEGLYIKQLMINLTPCVLRRKLFPEGKAFYPKE